MYLQTSTTNKVQVSLPAGTHFNLREWEWGESPPGSCYFFLESGPRCLDAVVPF